MNRSEHERACELVMLRDVDPVSAVDHAWLEAHLQECAECSEFAEALKLTANAFHQTPVMASAGLVNSTQLRVRERAVQLHDRETRMFLIGVSFCLGIVWSAASALIGWKASGWLANRVDLPAWVIGSGVVLFWLLPAVVIAAFLLVHQRPAWERSPSAWMATDNQGEVR